MPAELVFTEGANATLAGGTAVETTANAGTGARQTVDPRPDVVRLTASLTTNASAYEAGDAVGGVMTFADAVRQAGDSFRIESVTIVDEDQQLVAMSLVLFNASVTATDDTTFDPTDADLLNCLGHIPVAAADYSSFSDNAIAHVDAGFTGLIASGTSLFGVLVTRGTPTYASTSSVHVILVLVRD